MVTTLSEDVFNAAYAAPHKWGTWLFPFSAPLSPAPKRKTLRTEVIPSQVWTFDQLIGAVSVNVNIRMTVIALSSGVLWAYAPIAPTEECVRLVKELEAIHGNLAYIVLPTYAVEHKQYLGAFSRSFPDAEVWVAPYQWSFPLNLPISWLGLFPREARVLPEDGGALPWAGELQHATLGPIELGLGPFVEVAFFHAPSGTLLLTDSLVGISAEAPDICMDSPEGLLYHARRDASEPIEDTPSFRSKGWAKTVLFALFVAPRQVELVSPAAAIRDWAQSPAFPAPDSFFPFRWSTDDWEESFAAVRQTFFVPPLLRVFIFNRGPDQVLGWVSELKQWNFTRVIPAHFDAIDA
eukprot:gene8327-9894_t